MSTTDHQREGLEDEIIVMVRSSLVDDETNVRAAAAKAFDTLQEHIGARAIDATIPTLLEALRQPGQSSGTALQALKEVMAVRCCGHANVESPLTGLSRSGHQPFSQFSFPLSLLPRCRHSTHVHLLPLFLSLALR